ncbi:MAG TPA: bifunctional glutamate N-acetyltransferase/amino-acid acetyltransferase ArgJ [Tepidisphaeraceae bacterium]|nr:bifunctional glutamate N-acetyltransferase/amino-acid acetyltransferase ArgJ [Tepidisphaeraceae bacterium]
MPELHLLSPAGFRAAGVYAGIKSKHAPDVGLLLADGLAAAAAVFTTNRVFAAPVKVGRAHVKSGRLRGVVVNAGNANACTGKQGERDALRMCDIAASVAGAGAKRAHILPSSTGIIGHPLPMPKLERGIVEAGQYLGRSREHALLFADAILTTDLVRKSAAARFKIGRQTVTLAGVCKGSGMIGPRMSLKGPPQATLLAYLTTDAAVAPALLRKLLGQATDASFNAVTVDGHTSTNDTACLLASGASGATVGAARDARAFADALDEVCRSLAHQIALDGEGATRVVAITVRRATSAGAARAMARAIASSPLVKSAMHGNDPNWGRIVSAAGYAGVPFDADRCALTLQGTPVFRAGRPLPIDAAAVSASLNAKDVIVDLDCRAGTGSATVWTCDLSKEYVTINADYHT